MNDCNQFMGPTVYLRLSLWIAAASFGMPDQGERIPPSMNNCNTYLQRPFKKWAGCLRKKACVLPSWLLGCTRFNVKIERTCAGKRDYSLLGSRLAPTLRVLYL